jgi:RNA polymerase sigma factor (TIGR02999 family)
MIENAGAIWETASMSDVTGILRLIQQGDVQATEQLLPLVYEELRKLAAARLAQEKPGQTLQPTALVHEAYVRLVGARRAQRWDSEGHFFAAAAEAMRRILIERARRRAALKHGGDLKRIELGDELLVSDERAAELLALDEALAALEQHDPRAAQVVKLRYFAGLSHQDTASAMNMTRRAADRLWALAKAWLYQRMTAR